MAILSGALTARRFRVVGDLPEGWRDTWRDRLNEFSFNEPPAGVGKEAVEGWVLVQNLLDTSFDDFNRWLYSDLAVFALRVDSKSLPAKLFKATVEKRCQTWCEEKDVERCPPAVKSEIKDHLEAEWLKRTLPRVALTEAAWNLNEGYLILHSLSDGVAERFTKRFFRTFGMKLVAWSPLDWVDETRTRDDLMSTTPIFLGGAA
jgi:DNA recombination-dependent growth factor C